MSGFGVLWGQLDVGGHRDVCRGVYLLKHQEHEVETGAFQLALRYEEANLYSFGFVCPQKEVVIVGDAVHVFGEVGDTAVEFQKGFCVGGAFVLGLDAQQAGDPISALLCERIVVLRFGLGIPTGNCAVPLQRHVKQDKFQAGVLGKRFAHLGSAKSSRAMPASVILLYIRMLSTVMSREPDWTPSVVVRVSPRPTVGASLYFICMASRSWRGGS